MIDSAEIPHAPRQLGRFRVSRAFVKQCWPEFTGLFRDVVPISVAWDFNGVGEYTAFSKMFKEIQESDPVPLYEFTFHVKDDVTEVTCQLIDECLPIPFASVKD